MAPRGPCFAAYHWTNRALTLWIAGRALFLQKGTVFHTAAYRIRADGMTSSFEQSEEFAVERANSRIAELENALDVAHDELIILENQNLSLQTSLDLIAVENTRLSLRLTESQAVATKALLQADDMMLTLSAAARHCVKLAAEAKAANEKIEILHNALKAKERQVRAIEQLHSKSFHDPIETLLADTITL
jgi:chromosome segregation ATPase